MVGQVVTSHTADGVRSLHPALHLALALALVHTMVPPLGTA